MFFDGNGTSRGGRPRRPVNLGGGKSVKSRNEILAESKKLREERREQQQRKQAAIQIQSWIRGYLTRWHCCQQFVQPQEPDLMRLTFKVNVAIRLLLTMKKQKKKHDLISPLLQSYALRLTTTTQYSISSNSIPLQSTKYIWQQTLILLQQKNNSTLEPSLARIILSVCLPPADLYVTWKRFQGFEQGIFTICQTCVILKSFNSDLADWLWNYILSVMPRPQGNALLGAMYILMDNKILPDHNLETVVDLIRALLQQQQNNTLHQAALRLVQSAQGEELHPISPYNSNLLVILDSVLNTKNNMDVPLITHSTTLIVPLILLVWKDCPSLLHATGICTFHGSSRLEEIIQEQNMQIYSQDTNNQRQSGNIFGQQQSHNDDEDDEDDDEDQDDVGKDAAASKIPSVLNNYSSSVRLNKLDILTAPKLERLFGETRDSWDKQQMTLLLSSYPNTSYFVLLKRLATKLSSPKLWMDWAQRLFTTNQEYAAEQVAARSAYVQCLNLLLSLGNRTGSYTRTSASSPFLTQLAFGSLANDNQFVEQLWRYILVLDHNNSSDDNNEEAMDAQIHTLCTWSIFCDVFAQQLVAVRDDQFLRRHVAFQGYGSASFTLGRATNSDNQTRVVIVAEHVISHLKERLYNLYWSQPVLAQETQALLLLQEQQPSLDRQIASNQSRLAAARVRLFLSGTKLWNSLYERWCRLVRHAPFCDESTWFFPNITSFSFGDGIVRDVHQNNAMDVEDGNESDDNDDSSSRTGGQNDQHARNEDLETEVLAGAFQDPKMARILTSIPQCLPFERRVKLFHSLLQVDKARTQDETDEMRATMLAMLRGEEWESNSRVHVEIRRDSLFQDSMRQLNQLGSKLKKKVKVSFINKHGAPEAGIDGGGVFKEFLDDLIKEAFTPPTMLPLGAGVMPSSSIQLFAVTPLQTLMVNNAFTKDPQYLSHYEFLGRAVGKAVYESILVEPQFCLPFLNTLLGKSNTLEDLKNYDPEFYQSLVRLMDLSREDIEGAGLTFEANLGTFEQEAVELVPGGSNKPVTKDNVIQYAHLVSHRLLNVQVSSQIRAFLRGFRDLIPAAWVRLFSAHELQKLVSGDDSYQGGGIDVASFQAAMTYSGGYHSSQPIIEMFWEIVQEMTSNQQHKLLKFMTSCSRQPLLGFASLDPRPCIQQVRLRDSLFLESPSNMAKKAPLPTASTCLNLLKLPNYRDKELMRGKLLAAIEAGAGFELS